MRTMPTSWSELKTKRVDAMSASERAEYERAYAAAVLAAEVGERVRAAREAAGLSQRELAHAGWGRARRPWTAWRPEEWAPR